MKEIATCIDTIGGLPNALLAVAAITASGLYFGSIIEGVRGINAHKEDETNQHIRNSLIYLAGAVFTSIGTVVATLSNCN